MAHVLSPSTRIVCAFGGVPSTTTRPVIVPAVAGSTAGLPLDAGAGAVLPPPQPALEADYKRELGAHFGIVFNSLFALANMPIQRFGSMLISKGQFNGYIRLLKDNHRECKKNLCSPQC